MDKKQDIKQQLPLLEHMVRQILLLAAEMHGLERPVKTNAAGEEVALSTREIIEDLKEQLEQEEEGEEEEVGPEG